MTDVKIRVNVSDAEAERIIASYLERVPKPVYLETSKRNLNDVMDLLEDAGYSVNSLSNDELVALYRELLSEGLIPNVDDDLPDDFDPEAEGEELY